MSGYPPPPPDSFTGYSQHSGGNLPPDQFFPPNIISFSPGYPPSSQPYPQVPLSPSNQSYPYPGQVPTQQQTSNMSGGNVQVSPGYPPAAGYPTSGYPNSGGYPSTGGYPNRGGYPDSGAVQHAGFNPQIRPSAPDLSQMEKIPGYEGLTFDEEIVMPPAASPEWKSDNQERIQLQNLPSLTEEDVRDAAVMYATEHCCYGSGPAKKMVITDITMMSAFHYKFETFGEKRKTAWQFEPYNGLPVDGPMNGPAPRAWDIVATPPFQLSMRKLQWKDEEIKMEVPHTAFVKPCHTCIGNGRVRCEDCHGSGRRQCTWCRGRGVRSHLDKEERCTFCEGTGRECCTSCDATGQVKCETCSAKGQLKVFVELTITRTNHVDDYISETSIMPKELVRDVTGQVAFEEEYPRVYPITCTQDEAVRNASKKFVTKHKTAFPNEHIIKQRHCLRLIPIGEVSYMWKENSGLYYVYGYEHKVYFIEYPQKCCCCPIM